MKGDTRSFWATRLGGAKTGMGSRLGEAPPLRLRACAPPRGRGTPPRLRSPTCTRWSTSSKPAVRWIAMTSVGSLVPARRSARMLASVSASTWAVGSSRTGIRGSAKRARASKRRWRCPPREGGAVGPGRCGPAPGERGDPAQRADTGRRRGRGSAPVASGTTRIRGGCLAAVVASTWSPCSDPRPTVACPGAAGVRSPPMPAPSRRGRRSRRSRRAPVRWRLRRAVAGAAGR